MLWWTKKGSLTGEEVGIASSSKSVLGPLVLSDKDNCENPNEDACVPCMLCDETFTGEDKPLKDSMLKHLLTVHKLVIADVHLIANFTRYVVYWKPKLKEKPVQEFCSVINTNTLESDVAPQETYFLLSDILPEDKELRDELQQEKLCEVLSQQHKERTDTGFSRGCLFCRDKIEGNRAELFNHMATEHNFSVGQPDNLVYTNEFLDVLQEKLESCICTYCEKVFKDRFVLKEHMRKKGHKKINPKNKMYDKFYVVNYLELGKNWEAIQSENDDDRMSTQSLNDDWSDWLGDADFQSVCLFCDTRTESTDSISLHMKDCHRFDLASIKNDLNLTFYQQVKLINYIRRQMHQNICVFCQEKCVSRGDLLKHWEDTGHTSGQLPDIKEWDQPQYYFPTYEDDNLLCGLDDDVAADASAVSDKDTVDSFVIAEDLPDRETLLKESSVLSELVLS